LSKSTLKDLYQLKEYEAVELMNEFSNKCWTNKYRINSCWERSETPTQSTDSHIAAHHEILSLKKMLT